MLSSTPIRFTNSPTSRICRRVKPSGKLPLKLTCNDIFTPCAKTLQRAMLQNVECFIRLVHIGMNTLGKSLLASTLLAYKLIHTWELIFTIFEQDLF